MVNAVGRDYDELSFLFIENAEKFLRDGVHPFMCVCDHNEVMVKSLIVHSRFLPAANGP